MFDLLIRGATVIDGTRQPRFRADVAINSQRIAAVEPQIDAAAQRTIDAKGLVLAPGFIDVHNHSDGWLLKSVCLEPKVSQGFTTEVLMSDGISYAPLRPADAADWITYLRPLNGLNLADYDGWQSLEDYARHLDRCTAQNSALQIPLANVRVLACGWGRQAADDTQILQMQREVRRGLEMGAVALSSGLDYISQCFCTTDEIVRALEPLRGRGLPYVTHVRYKLGTLGGVQEAVEIARRLDIPLHVSHLKATTPQQRDELLDYIDRQAISEVDLSFDIYPYLAGSTLLASLSPYEIWEQGPLNACRQLARPHIRRRFAELLDAIGIDWKQSTLAWLASRQNQPWQGRTVAEFIASRRRSAADAIADLLIDEQLAVLAVIHPAQDESLLEPFLSHPRQMIGTDAILAPGGVVHPRAFGTTGRILGSLVRDRQLFSLEDAVYKLTAFPAARFGLKDRGRIASGCVADLVLFDPQTVCDTATYSAPHSFCQGIERVLVGGQTVWPREQATPSADGRWPGRALRRGE